MKKIRNLIVVLVAVIIFCSVYWEISSVYTRQIDDVIESAFLEDSEGNGFECISDEEYLKINECGLKPSDCESAGMNMVRGIFKWFKKESTYEVKVTYSYVPSEEAQKSDDFYTEQRVSEIYRIRFTVERNGRDVLIKKVEHVETIGDVS